jgi:serine/threonine protein phosphatase PrpC
VANAGDSRCILCRHNAAVPLTEDHKPNNPGEERRIQAAGGFVTEGRVNGCLNLSRAIGDMNYKQVCHAACRCAVQHCHCML